MGTRASRLLLLGTVAAFSGCTGDGPVPPATHPPGDEERASTDVLEAGSAVMQDDGPLAGMDVHLSGFHPMKERPDRQMETHHFCRQVNEDFAQCALFDGNGAEANLTGIEYIISEKLFGQLPAEERRYWHPHNYEILSGQLVAPGLPLAADKALMKSKMNSYGKTWHTWHSREGTQPGTRLPTGPAMLAWSFNRDGEALPALVESRDRRMRISSAGLRQDRQDLVDLANPQTGVDALRGHFPDATAIPGVVDAAASTAGGDRPAR